MTQLQAGQRSPLNSFLSSDAFELTIGIQAPAGMVIDFACFGLDSTGKLSDDRYMTFFNQPETPCGGVRLTADNAFDLTKLPDTIDRLTITASIDGDGRMSQINASDFTFKQGGAEKAKCPFSGANFDQERAIMVLDLYRKGGIWRCSANLQGFNEGLDAIVRHFGGEVASSEPEPAQAPTPAISLEKKIADKAPALVSLAKKATVSLEKTGLTGVQAKVGLVLDASGSMNGQYRHGRVQEVVDRLLPLAVHFDDDGELDCWAFGAKTQQLSAVTLSNYQDFIDTDNRGWTKWKLGSRINCEPKAIQAVIDYYSASGDRSTPVYVLFISDGGVSENRRIEKLIREAAELPIFWQFVGIGGRSYGILERLDDMPGRKVDNCDFFALDDLHDISEEELYDRLMTEFPGWIKAAKREGVLL
jgi:stress response protein SCP2